MHNSRFAILATGAFLALLCASADDTIRIMSFNICHCATHYSLNVTDADVRRTASVIAAEQPDFVCLQEVDKETTRSAGIDQTARFAELLTENTGVRYYGTFGKGRDYQGGEFGVAILSKSEPLSVSTTSIDGTEPRSLLVCEFEDFCVATVHLDTDRDCRTNSIQQIRNALARYSKPVFITGDWNATPTSDATLALMKEFLTVISPESGIRTFGDINGTDYVIDYVAVDTANADRFYVRRGYCVSNMGNGEGSSDHNPVIVDVVKRPDTPRWVEENAVTTERTGIWSESIAYDRETLKAELSGEYSFSPTRPSGGKRVVIEVTTDLCETWGLPDPNNKTQGAVRLGTNGCFQVWTLGGWVDVEAEGITPTTGVDYTFRFTFDYANCQYSVCVATTPSSSFIPLCTTDGGGAVVTQFPLATSATAVSGVRFTGDGVFTSLLGDWLNKTHGFVLRLL